MVQNVNASLNFFSHLFRFYLQPDEKDLLVNVNLMVKKFQDFISVISNQNVSQGHINFPMKLKICTSVCRRGGMFNDEETADNFCLKVSKPAPPSNNNPWQL